MRDITKRFGSLLMIFALVTTALGAGAGGAIAATTSTGDLSFDGTDEVTGFAAEDGENRTVTYETDLSSQTLDDFEELSLEIKYENNTLVTYTQDDVTIVAGDDDDTTVLEVEFTIEDSDLEKLPGDAGESTTVDATITELEDATDATEVTEESTIDYTFDTTHAVRTVFSSDDDIVSDFEAADDEDDGILSSLSGLNPFGSSAASMASIEDDIGINGTETDVTVYSEDDDITEAFDDQLEDTEDGDRVGMLMTSNLDDGIVYVFANEPGEKIGCDDVDEDDNYIVANEGGVFDVNFGENYEDEDTASLSLTAGEKFDRGALQDDLEYSMFQAWGLSIDGFSSSLSDLWPF